MDNGYLARSWKALSSDAGWWKTVLILSLVGLIPVFGPIVVLGYLFQWGRDSAWGVERSLPRRMGRFGVYCKSGAIVFVVLLVWYLVADALYTLIAEIPYVGVAFALILLPVLCVATMIANIMALRAVVYDSFAPGFQIAIAWDMAKRDPKGLLRVFVIVLLGVLAQIVSLGFVAIVVLLYAFAAQAGSGSLTALLICSVPLGIVLGIVFGLVGLFVSTTACALSTRALGYWMAQFEPARWGASREGVPAGVGPVSGKPAAADQAAAPTEPESASAPVDPEHADSAEKHAESVCPDEAVATAERSAETKPDEEGANGDAGAR